MKNVRLSVAILSLLTVGHVTIYAQKTATWKGGAPGRSTDWAYAQNWKEGRIPNAFSDVLIPDVSTASGYLPIISNEVKSINSLTLQAGAQLRIEKSGRLCVLERIEIFDANSILNAGSLQLPASAFRAGTPKDTAMSVYGF